MRRRTQEMHGWYSKTPRKRLGHDLYENSSGDIVKVTSVTYDKVNPYGGESRKDCE